MREAFARIARGYETARQEPLTRHPMARFIREDAAEQVREVLPDEYQSLLVQGNPGVGNWAQVPWIAIFDPSITETATRGYYIVYLFSSDLTKVYLSLNQGTTIVHDEFGASYVEELGRRAALMRQRLPERGDSFLDIDINLASDGNLPRGYEAGHACGLAYDLENLPVDETLSADLLAMVPIYMNLRSRGGVSPLEGATAEPTDDRSDTITERRRYRTHRSIERNPNAGSRAKAIQGYTCQGCSFDFKVVYGEVGSQYIEAHHLTPLADLPDDRPVELDPQHDFAVLCANCHRIMHRKEGPKTVAELRQLDRVEALRRFHEQLDI